MNTAKILIITIILLIGLPIIIFLAFKFPLFGALLIITALITGIKGLEKLRTKIPL